MPSTSYEQMASIFNSGEWKELQKLFNEKSCKSPAHEVDGFAAEGDEDVSADAARSGLLLLQQ